MTAIKTREATPRPLGQAAIALTDFLAGADLTWRQFRDLPDAPRTFRRGGREWIDARDAAVWHIRQRRRKALWWTER